MMDDFLNKTVNASISENIEFSEKPTFSDNLWTILRSIPLAILIITTIIGNIFVITAILRERNLNIVGNYLVLSLAIADLLIAVLVMPFSAVYEVRQKWTFGTILCDIWTSFDVLFCSASILHLLAIAVDRYWAVTHVQYIRSRNIKTVGSMIAVIWLTSIIISIPPFLGWKDNDNHQQKITEDKICIVTQDVAYQVFATVSAFYVPLVVILFLYWKIYLAARNRLRKRRASKAHISIPFSKMPKTPKNHFDKVPKINIEMKNLQTEQSFHPSKQELLKDNQENKLEIKRLETKNLTSLKLSESHVEFRVSEQESSSIGSSDKRLRDNIFVDDVECQLNESSSYEQNIPSSVTPECQVKKHETKVMRRVLSRFQKGLRRKKKTTEEDSFQSHFISLELKRERKTATTLAIITGVFIVCWLPFFTLALVMSILKDVAFDQHLVSLFLWLGYFNSTLNPVIYTVFNPDFRIVFRKILCGRNRSARCV